MNVPETLHSSTLTNKVDQLFSTWDKPDSPGCALGIIHRGEWLYHRGYGMANLEHAIPISPGSVFRIASTSKQFTATCIALLAEAGKLALDDPIQKYLPEIPAYDDAIQIQHLVHHTSGLRDYIELMELSGMRDEDYYTDEEALAKITRQKATNFPPGEMYLYSNTGYYLLGIIVQRASGLSLRDYAKKHIFDPLGMESTHFKDDYREIVRNLATGYAPDERGGYRICMTTLDMVGDGGVHTTIEDMKRWDANFYENRLGDGGPKLIEQITTKGILTNGEEIPYAFGLNLGEHQGEAMVCHGGAFVGYRAEMARFPDQELTVICLSNLSTFEPDKMAKQTASLYLEALLGRGPFTSLPPQAEEPGAQAEIDLLTGLYWNADSGAILTLENVNGKLMLHAWDESLMLTPTGERSWRAPDAPVEVLVEFTLAPSSAARQIRLTVEDEKPELLDLIQVVEPGREALTEYAGSYYSEELDTIYQFETENQGLVLANKHRPKKVFKTGSADMFWLGEITIVFERQREAGSTRQPVTGFKLNAGRVRKILFTKSIRGTEQQEGGGKPEKKRK